MVDEHELLADAVLGALAGTGLCDCPQCGTKNAATTKFADDIEHPDEVYSCHLCQCHWTYLFPEHACLVRDHLDHIPGLIHFDRFGNQSGTFSYGSLVRERPPFVFTDTLIWHEAYRSKYKVSFTFKRKSTGTTVYAMLPDFKKLVMRMVYGEVTGTFTFRKCGAACGVTFYEPKPARAKKTKKVK